MEFAEVILQKIYVLVGDKLKQKLKTNNKVNNKVENEGDPKLKIENL